MDPRNPVDRSSPAVIVLGIFFSRACWIGKLGIEAGDKRPRAFQRAFLCFLLSFLSFEAIRETAFAEHEPDHRYLISGYVRDEIGVPIPDASVSLEHKGGEKQRAKTNSDGYYESRFHLHNNNLGDEIIVTVGQETKRHKVQFDPDDGLSFRGGSVDFGAPGKEGAKVWIYLTAVFLAVMGVLVYRILSPKVKPQKKSAAVKAGKRAKKKRR